MFNPYRSPYTPPIEVRPEMTIYRDGMSGHLIKEITEQAMQVPENPLRQTAYQILSHNGWANEAYHSLWKMAMSHLDYLLFSQGAVPNQAHGTVAEAQCRYHASTLAANQPMLMNSLDPATQQKIRSNISEFQTLCSQIQTHERNLQAAKGQTMYPYQMFPGMMPQMQPGMMPMQMPMQPNPMVPMMPNMQPGMMPMHPGMMPQMQQNPMMGMGMPPGQMPHPSQMPAVAYQRQMPQYPYAQQPPNPTAARMGVAAIPGTTQTQPVQVAAPQPYGQQHMQPQMHQQPAQQPMMMPAQVSSAAPTVMAQPQSVAPTPPSTPTVLTAAVAEEIKWVWSESHPYHFAYNLVRFKAEQVSMGDTPYVRLREIKMQSFDVHDTRRYLQPMPGVTGKVDNDAFVSAMASVLHAKKIAVVKRELAKAPKTEGVLPVFTKPVHLGDFVELEGNNSYREAVNELMAGSEIEFDQSQPILFRMVSYQPWFVTSESNLRNLENATNYDDLCFILNDLFTSEKQGGLTMPVLKKIDEMIAEYVSFVLSPGIGVDGRIDSFANDWYDIKGLIQSFSGVAYDALKRSFKQLMGFVVAVAYGKDVNMQFSDDGKDDGEDRVTIKTITDVIMLPVPSSSIAYGGVNAYGEVPPADSLHHVLMDILKNTTSRYVAIVTSDDRVLYATKSFLIDRVVLSKTNVF